MIQIFGLVTLLGGLAVAYHIHQANMDFIQGAKDQHITCALHTAGEATTEPDHRRIPDAISPIANSTGCSANPETHASH